jgi:hypothetical protein
MTDQPLSPAAQAVLDAFLKTPGEEPMPGWDYGRDLAAALRAIAQELKYIGITEKNILAIAAELDDTSQLS